MSQFYLFLETGTNKQKIVLSYYFSRKGFGSQNWFSAKCSTRNRTGCKTAIDAWETYQQIRFFSVENFVETDVKTVFKVPFILVITEQEELSTGWEKVFDKRLDDR
jgi:hypothetical protein